LPSWRRSLHAETMLDLFQFSDAPIVEKLNFARTQIEGGE
jgi:gentisate 1,2-dioxygenase